VNKGLKEYLRLGRIFNAEIIALILVLSYLLSARLYDIQTDYRIIILLFIGGVFAHIGGAYNNDRLDLIIDKKARYTTHKPLVSGSISLKISKKIEFVSVSIFIISILIASYISESTQSKFFSQRILVTIIYICCAFVLAYIYNRYNKSNMLINVVGQLYASFIVLIGMSIIIDFDFILFLSAIVIGINGVYLNIIEADFKDFEGDIVNVPKSLGVRFKGEKAVNISKFYVLNDVLKIFMFVLILYILVLEEVSIFFISVAFGLFIINYLVRITMFKNLSSNREKMKRFIAAQELTSIFLISTIFMIINPFLPILVFLFVTIWLSMWNKALWGTYFRPQV